jgi:uncharacterized repeat protein (TIGR01451 family)
MGRRIFTSTLVFTCSLAVLAILFLALAGAPPPARAFPAAPCTTVSSDIVSSTTWSDSCYRIVTSTVAIRAGVILTIAPATGTRVEFDPATQLIVDGSLQALGAPDRPITFTSALTATAARCAWRTIGVPLLNEGLRLQYATVEYACAGLRISDADFVQVYSSTFRYVGDGGASDGAITGDTDNSEIVNTVIYSATNGIVLNESFGNVIRSNTIHDVAGYGLGLVKQTISPGGGDNQIADNTVWNTAHGLRLESGSGNAVQANSLYQNTAAALYLSEQTSAQVSYNHIFSNGGSSAYRAGIFISGTGTSPSLVHNVVYDANGDAVMLDATAAASNPIFPALYANTNALCSVPSYELRNNSAAVVVNAANNWWGTNVPAFGVNLLGPIALSDPMLLSVTLPANQLLGGSTAIVTVTLRDSLNNTVPAPNHAVDVNARRVVLTSPIGSFNPGSVTVNDQGVATATLTASPAGGAGYVMATGFCNYPVTATLQVTATNTDLVVLKDDNVVPVAMGEKPAARALIDRSAVKMARPQALAINPGEVITYTIAAVNVSSYTATNVILTETLPLYTDYVGGGWTNVSARTYITSLGALAPGDGRILYFAARLQNPISTTVRFIYNTVCGFAVQRESTPADNCHTTDTPLFVGPGGGRVYLPLILNRQAPPALPQVSFTRLTYVVVEGTPQAAIDVKLERTATAPITVSYFTADGTATAGQDYTATSGSLVFAPGQTTKTFNVGIISDTLTEYWETVDLELSNPQNARLGYPGVATLNIEDARTCAVPSATLISLYSPMDLAYDHSADRLYIANRDGPLGGSLNIGVISPTPQITRTVTGLFSAQGVAQDAARQRLYVVGWDWLNVIDSVTYVPTATVSLGTGVNAHAVAYNPNNSKIYVTGFGDNSITIIDASASTPSVIARLTSSSDHPLLEPSYIAIEPNSGKVYVTNHAHGRPSGWVTVVDGFTNQIVKTIYPNPGGELYGITADAVHGHIYLAAINAANIYVIDAATDNQLGSFQVRRWSDNQPVPLRMIAVNPNPGLGTKIRLWLTSSSTEDYGLDNIISLTGNWPSLESPALGADLPPSPERGLRFDPASKYLFVASAAANRVTILRDTPETQQCLWPFVTPRGPARAAGTPTAGLYVVVNQTTH